jgi:hypothetical protein
MVETSQRAQSDIVQEDNLVRPDAHLLADVVEDLWVGLPQPDLGRLKVVVEDGAENVVRLEELLERVRVGRALLAGKVVGEPAWC